MFEVNGQWYILGNRSLCNLDLSANDISEIGLRHLLEAVSIQEATVEQAQNSDVGHGIYRISLHVRSRRLNIIFLCENTICNTFCIQLNSFSVNTPQLGALNSLLNSRNPYYEGNDDADGDQSVSASDSASALGDDGTS